MHQTEDTCLWGQLLKCRQTILKLSHIITFELLAHYIKDVNKYSDILKNVLSLGFKVLLDEHILTSTIPQMQYQITKESNPSLGDVMGECNSLGIVCQIVCEDD